MIADNHIRDRRAARLSQAAQDAGEEAYNALDVDAGDCGCETCIVRDILDAAWPSLRELALLLAEPSPA